MNKKIDPNTATAEFSIRGKTYIVQSIFTGNSKKSLQESLLNLAEKKALKDMQLSK